MWKTAFVMVTLTGLLTAQLEEKGKTLFQQRCSACHKLDQKLIGPALAGVTQRREKTWFLKFVTNSQAMIQAGDPIAVKVYEENNKQVMTPFPDLTQEDLEALWSYLSSAAQPATSTTPAQTPASATAAESPGLVYPGQAAPMAKEDFAFLRQTFWWLVGVAVVGGLLIAWVIRVFSERYSKDPDKH